LRLVLFDVDGTLVDSGDLIYRAIVETFAAYGRAAPERRFALGGVGLSLEQAIARLLGGEGPVAEMSETYRTTFHRLRQDPALHEPLFPGAREVLDTLARRGDVVLGLATGKSRRGVGAIVERFGWHGRFATVQTADTHPSKPHPSMVATALAETGIAPGRAVLVGDTTFDMEMARAGGIGAIGVVWGNHTPDALEEAGAHRVIARFEELSGIIDELTA